MIHDDNAIIIPKSNEMQFPRTPSTPYESTIRYTAIADNRIPILPIGCEHAIVWFVGDWCVLCDIDLVCGVGRPLSPFYFPWCMLLFPFDFSPCVISMLSAFAYEHSLHLLDLMAFYL